MTPVAATAKGSATRELILERAFAIARRNGLEGLSIGDLAGAVGMSKSGVFAHFGSREDLQRSVLDWTAQRFAETVIHPALARPRGLQRLRAIVLGWFEWVLANEEGCVILGAAGEYDGRPGPMRDRIVGWLGEWHAQLAKAVGLCVETGEFVAGTDPQLVAFELAALADGLHNTRLHDPAHAEGLARRAFERLIHSYSA
ncbi:MAG: TetR/AcrR family transcriptional regulator [Lysobacteraceae bacterium]|nr:MAG: TetR/AcrR family transcriptional regulator [Xanthomonadaceae bacterium]